MKFDGISVTSF